MSFHHRDHPLTEILIPTQQTSLVLAQTRQVLINKNKFFFKIHCLIQFLIMSRGEVDLGIFVSQNVVFCN